MVISEKVKQRLEEWAKAWKAHYERPEQYAWLNKPHIWTPEFIEVKHKEENNRLEFQHGKKYIRVVQTSDREFDRSAHAFLNPITGEVFKAASWKAPAKDARYNLLDDASFERMLKRLDWAGGYLYK